LKILVLGGDGFLGWPTTMYLSNRGHDVAVVDNYFRRRASMDLDSPQLYPTPNLNERASAWKIKSDRTVEVFIGDITEYDFLLGVFKKFVPDTVVHYAEQPSAPYSMIDQKCASFTLTNNLSGTLNLAFAVNEVNPGCHVVKLGTMGEYGTPNIDIEEGFIEIEHKGRKDRFLFPRQAGSLYHTTKIQDTDLLYFYVRVWGLRVTDLMQGPVYGILTDEMEEDDCLLPCFSYDEVFGTVLNRFLVQAVAGIPLTVYGKGGQTRGYLNIRDTMQCVGIAAENPPARGELRVLNQFTEIFSVNELAEKVKGAAKILQMRVEIQSVPNPRLEAEEHYYNPVLDGFFELGLKPNFLTEELLVQMMRTILRYKENIRIDRLYPKTKWK